ncbi:MAG: ergothioneine biosynthesis protein EgtB [Gammaproteobacteria bacterium]|nr:ergothioneine biosynthesis protein EgtB [Gammaproteobacteria bacterium]
MLSIAGTRRMAPGDAEQRQALAPRYVAVRRATEELCRPLATEDYGLQAMADASPPKWHLAHTTWFFETFLLKPFLHSYSVFHPRFEYLFNSYYQTIGAQFPRPERGLLSRPTVAEVYRYRAHVDAAMPALLTEARAADFAEVARRTALGCHHEQQHQELLLTDIKYNFSLNPLRPAYRADLPEAQKPGPAPLIWVEHQGGVHAVGHAGADFAFDNELPRHSVYLRPYALAARLVTCGDYLAFITAGGYRRPDLWLADGWRTACERGWQAPLYWEQIDGRWWQFTLAGMRPVNENEPLCHVSFYEADAYARFLGKRLPSEQEWEVAAAALPIAGNLCNNGYLHPVPAALGELPMQRFGDVWEWTQSAYAPYPGYRPPAGALGEYNGKFMVNQMVLRGGSCATPADHLRATYRNFFYPADRWQFSGIRLAEDR